MQRVIIPAESIDAGNARLRVPLGAGWEDGAFRLGLRSNCDAVAPEFAVPASRTRRWEREFAFEGIMEVEHQLFVEEHGHPRGYAIHFHDRISGSVFVLRFGG